MKKLKISFVMIFLIMILAVSAVSAADVDDSSDSATLTADNDAIGEIVSDVDDDVQAADNDAEVVAADDDGNFTSLKTLIDTSGNNLTLEKNYVRAIDESDIEINKDFTIDGQGKYTLDANNLGRIFKVTSGTLTLKGLTLTNGITYDDGNTGSVASEEGSAILVESGANLNADHVTFTNNTAATVGTISNYGTVHIDNSVFDTNDVVSRSWGASAIYNEGTIIINNTEFKNNLKIKANRTNGDYMSGVVTNAGNLEIYNSNFTNNSGTHGGAISSSMDPRYGLVAKCIVDNCRFIDNSAYDGAAIYSAGSAELNVKNSYFENNVASDYGSTGYTSAGGAICLVQVTNPVTIYNNTFKGNKALIGAAPDGGAISIEKSPVNVDLCTFEGNAAGKGGAISSDSGTTLSVSRSSFNGNDATNGTAVYNNGDLTVSNNTFGENDKIYSKTEVKKDGSNVTISPIANVTYGNPVVVSYSINNRTNNVTASVSQKNGGIAIPVTTAVVVINDNNVTITNLTAGQYVINIVNNEDNNFATSFETAVFNVTKATPIFDVKAYVDDFGNIIVNVTTNDDATDNVTFKIDDDEAVPIAIENGSASFDTFGTVFAKGTHNITVAYDGDVNYEKVSNKTTVEITKDVPVIEIESIKVDEYGAIVVKANITKGATGNVTFDFYNLDTGKNLTGVIIPIGENGTIEYDELTPFEKGNYNVQIGYAGDANYYAQAENTQVDVNVTKLSPSMNYTVKVVGGEVSIAVTLPSAINGNLTVIYPSGFKENVTINNGSATIYAVFMNETGDLAITASFAGNDQYYATESIIGFVIKEATLVKTSTSVSVVYKNNAKVTVKLTNLVTNKAIAGAPIEITVNGKTYKGTTDKDGNAVITISANMVPKKYTANVVYKGTDRLESDLDEFTLTVKKATPKVTAKKKTFKKSKKVKKYTITLKDNKGKAIKKAKVTIKVGKKTFKATTNAKGKAVFKLKKLTKKAKYTAKVTYKGNKYFNKVTKKVKITIK